jgi:diacylglycerol kinase family enzyme
VATDLAHIDLVGHRPVPYQVDGDYLGEADRFDLRYWEDALRLVVP